MVRALTDGEKTIFRRAGQWSEIYAAIHRPATVYTARVNQTFSSFNSIARVSYDGGIGTLANVLPGMTLYIGSSAGKWDKGRLRIRKVPTETILYFGETSEVCWADNDYLTVVDEFGLWEKHPTITGGVSYMDFDLAYTNQHTLYDPIVRMGPQAWVGWLSAGDVVFSPDASGSSVFDSTISTYAWTAPGAASTSGMDSAAPTIHYSAAGQYRVSCTVTSAAGKSSTGHRRVFVFDIGNLPDRAAVEQAPSGSAEGGWQMSMKLAENAGDVRPGAMVVLFSRDFDESGAVTHACPYSGYENQIMVGWVSKVRTRQNNLDGGDVVVDVMGADWWMDRLPGFTVGMEYSSGTASAWTQMHTLTVDRGLWHLLHWRSTADAIMDVYLPGDSKLAPALEAASGSFRSQLQAFIQDTILGSLASDRWGCLYGQVDSQYIPVANRGSIPTVLALAETDWQGELSWEEELSKSCSMLDISGISYDGSTAKALLSRAPGDVPTDIGSAESIDNLLFSSQSQANELCGLLFAKLNNIWPSLPIITAGDLRMVDIAPRQYLQVTVAAADTLRGFDLTLRLIPRSVSMQISEHGEIYQELTCEGEISAGPSIRVDPPATPDYNVPNQPNYSDSPAVVPLPDIPSIDIPDWVMPDAGLPGLVCRNDNGYTSNGPFTLYVGNSSISSGFYTSGMMESWVRRSAATYRTQVVVDAYWEIQDENGLFHPQIDDIVPMRIIANAGLGVDLEAAEYSWDMKPSENGGHGILRASFSPTDGFNAAYYYFYVDNAGVFQDNFELQCVYKSTDVDAGESQILSLGGRIGIWVKPPARSDVKAIYKMTNSIARGKGTLEIIWRNECIEGPKAGNSCNLGGHTYRFPSSWQRYALNSTDLTTINPAYTPSLPYDLPTSDFWWRVSGDSSPAIMDPMDTLDYSSLSRAFGAGVFYFGVEAYLPGGMDSYIDCTNGILSEITQVVWTPEGGSPTNLFTTGSVRRSQIISAKVYNVCARE